MGLMMKRCIALILLFLVSVAGAETAVCAEAAPAVTVNCGPGNKGGCYMRRNDRNAPAEGQGLHAMAP